MTRNGLLARSSPRQMEICLVGRRILTNHFIPALSNYRPTKIHKYDCKSSELESPLLSDRLAQSTRPTMRISFRQSAAMLRSRTELF